MKIIIVSLLFLIVQNNGVNSLFANTISLFQIQSAPNSNEIEVIKTTNRSDEFIRKTNLSVMDCIPSTGMLSIESFFIFASNTIQEWSYDLIKINLKDGSNQVIFSFPTRQDQKLKPTNIVFVNTGDIYFTARDLSDAVLQPSSFLFHYDLKKYTTRRLPIEIKFGVSTNDGKQFFFSGNNQEILVHENGQTTKLGIKGLYPSISPNSTKLAYIVKTGWLRKVSIFSFKNNDKKVLMQSFFSDFKSILRWSTDNKLLAVHKVSDLTLQPLYIIDVNSNNTIQKYRNNRAANWFFTDK